MIYRDGDLPPEIDRSILVSCYGGWAYGVDRLTGAIRWSRDLDSRGNVHVAFRYGALLLSALAAELIRLDYATGTPTWVAPTSDRGPASVLIEHDCILCAKGAWVDCFDHQGRRLWAQRIPSHGATGIALAFPGNVVQAPDILPPRRD